MKRFSLLAALTLLMAWPCAGPAATPLSTLAQATPDPAVTPTPLPKVIYSPAPKLDAALKQAMLQVSRDLKAKKLTSSQASSLRARVRTIRRQELSYIKANGKRQLTGAQEAALTQKLDQIIPSL